MSHMLDTLLLQILLFNLLLQKGIITNVKSMNILQRSTTCTPLPKPSPPFAICSAVLRVHLSLNNHRHLPVFCSAILCERLSLNNHHNLPVFCSAVLRVRLSRNQSWKKCISTSYKKTISSYQKLFCFSLKCHIFLIWYYETRVVEVAPALRCVHLRLWDIGFCWCLPMPRRYTNIRVFFISYFLPFHQVFCILSD